jgi:hypothetical protein
VEQSARIQSLMQHMTSYIDNILYETAIPIVLVSNLDDYQFKEEPIEFIRRQQAYQDTMFSDKACMIDLVTTICKYKQFKNDTQPVYLDSFINFCMENLH